MRVETTPVAPRIESAYVITPQRSGSNTLAPKLFQVWQRQSGHRRLPATPRTMMIHVNSRSSCCRLCFKPIVQRGIMAATEWLKPGSTQTVRCKGAALTLLGRNGGKSVTPVILGVARSEPDLKLRARAISALGATNDDSVVDALRDFALSSPENDIVEASLYALSKHTGERAIAVLSDIAISGKTTTQRKLAIASIATRPGEPAVDALLPDLRRGSNRRDSQSRHLRFRKSQERAGRHQTLRHRTQLRQYRASQSCDQCYLAARRR